MRLRNPVCLAQVMQKSCKNTILPHHKGNSSTRASLLFGFHTAARYVFFDFAVVHFWELQLYYLFL